MQIGNVIQEGNTEIQ
jgi:dynein heavy chain